MKESMHAGKKACTQERRHARRKECTHKRTHARTKESMHTGFPQWLERLEKLERLERLERLEIHVIFRNFPVVAGIWYHNVIYLSDIYFVCHCFFIISLYLVFLVPFLPFGLSSLISVFFFVVHSCADLWVKCFWIFDFILRMRGKKSVSHIRDKIE